MSIHIGTCAWSYDDWRGVFYPEHLPAGDRLAFFSGYLSAVEIDSTFYHSPALNVVTHWAEVTPPDFIFAAKLPRVITHEQRLRAFAEPLFHFLDPISPLGTKLACILIQLPAFFSPKHDEHALRDFVRHLPREYRFAIEFRDPAWHQPRIVHLLEEHRVCWVWNDVSTLDHAEEAALGFWPQTADFIYLRLLGDLATKYRRDGGRIHHHRQIMWPREKAMENWVEKIRGSSDRCQRTLVFVSNHYEGLAPASAARFSQKIGMPFSLPSVDDLAGGDSRQMRLL